MKNISGIVLLILFAFTVAHAQLNWQSGGPYGGSIRTLCVNPGNGYIFAGSWKGMYLSTNNGSSWSAVNNGLTSNGISDIAINHSNGYVFAGSWSNNKRKTFTKDSKYSSASGGVFLSTSNGNSWTLVNSGLTNLYVNTIEVNQSNGNIFAGTDGGGVLIHQ